MTTPDAALAASLESLRAVRDAFAASIEADEEALDAILASRPEVRGHDSADLRERLAEARLILNQVDELLEPRVSGGGTDV